MPLSRTEINRLRSLRDKKAREAAGLFVIENEKVIRELLARAGLLVELYATPEWIRENTSLLAARAENGPAVMAVSTTERERISQYPSPSAVLGVGRIERRALVRGELAHGLTLALDGIQDPGNVGALLRVADWFALDRVLLSPDCADLFSQKVIDASMGSFARVPVHTAPLPDALAGIGVPVLGCDLAGTDVHALAPERNAVIVIGSEGRGLSEAVAAHLTQRITIPRFGGAESLNAAVAAGIVCDHLRPR